MGTLKGNKDLYLDVLSPLEKDVIEVLWKVDNAKVKDIFDKVVKKRDVAQTSVAVILDRLHDKKLVKRKMESCRGGYRYVYSSKSTKEEFHKTVIQGTVDKLIKKFGGVATAYFNERFGQE
jgi:predicted transcriptional regulator